MCEKLRMAVKVCLTGLTAVTIPTSTGTQMKLSAHIVR